MTVAQTLATPVLRYEMCTRMRDWRSFAVVCVYVGLVAVTVGTFLLQYGDPVVGNRPSPGVDLFGRLVLVQLVSLSFITPLVMAGAASAERERGTWEILLMTPLSSLGIVCSKAAARISFVLLAAVAALPLVSISLLFGDISLLEVLPTYSGLLGMVLLQGAVALLISTFKWHVMTTTVLGLAVCSVIGAGCALLLRSALPFAAPSERAVTSMPAFSAPAWWAGGALSIAVSALLLVAAGWRIRGSTAMRWTSNVSAK